jgi:hypothetical protein
MKTRRSFATTLGSIALAAAAGCARRDAATPQQMQARIEQLQGERDQLRARQTAMVTKDPRLAGMPGNGVRVGVPTALARTLVQRVLGGFVDSVTLTLTHLKVHKAGKVKKVVTLGEYDLRVVIDEVTGKLETGEATIGFGGDQITVALPVRITSGTGDATIDFKWDGKNVSGAVCGDMEIQQKVSGRVRPAGYSVSGGLLLAATTRQILASPRFPRIKVKLKVEPSPESWAAVQKILDDKGGVCGFVLDKVNIAGVLEGLIGKGFDVRLPTEKIKPMAVPVGIAPAMTVRGEPLTITVKVGHLAITEHMIWLGADVGLGQAPSPPAARPSFSKRRP